MSHLSLHNRLSANHVSHNSVANSLSRLGLTLIAMSWICSSAHAIEPSGRLLSYTVVKGDTVQSVSSNLLDDPRNFIEVAKASKLKDANRIYPGNVLAIPVELLRGTAAPLLLSSANGSVKIDGVAAQAGAQVKEGSKLETAEGATAVLTRDDGTRLTVLPSSVAEITKNRSIDKDAGWLRSSIRLVSGAMDFVVQKIGLKDHVKVDTPTSTIGVRGTQYRVGAATSSSKVEVLEGTVATGAAKANLTTGTALALNGGFGTIVPAGGAPLGAIALLPAPKLTNLNSDAQIVRATNTINIAPIAGAASYVYIVSPQGLPSVQTLAGKTDKPSFSLPRLPDAKYQLVVRAVDKNGLEGFDVLTPFSVAIIDKPFELIAKPNPDGTLTVSWDNGLPNTLYRVELSSEPDFKRPLAIGYVKDKAAMMLDVEPGNYYWRVGEPKMKGAKSEADSGGWEYSEIKQLSR
jgi:hypothetical protein